MPQLSDDPTRWRAAFWTLLFVTAVTKLLLASHLSLFVDEAFYWQESRHLAWSYSDLPPMTAWLIRLGESVLGHGTLGVRWPFIAMGLLIPLLVRTISERHFGASLGWQAGCWAFLLPLLASFGVLALPDVPLTLFFLLALAALDRLADRPDSPWPALVLGVSLALAWLTHYRAAILWLAGLVLVLASPRGRRLVTKPWAWIALAIGLTGLLPILLGDHAVGADALQFQLIDRHPWTFHADALLQPLEQALVTTPILYALLLAVGFAAWAKVMRRQAPIAPWDLLAAMTASFLIGYFLLGLFADAQRFRVHWPLPAYLALIVALPFLLAQWRERTLAMGHAITPAVVLAAVGTLVVYAYFALAAIPGGANLLSRYKAFPEHFVGWNEAAEITRSQLALPEFRDALLVADNFMLAAELDFALDGTRPVYSLDHPLNAKHGRAAQLRLWQRDEHGLGAHGGETVLLVVDETAGRARERGEWLASLCQRVEQLELLSSVDRYGGRKRMAWYRGIASVLRSDQPCITPASQ